MRYITKSEKETKELAQKIAQENPEVRVFLLCGDLGGGKTQFVKGLAQYIGSRDMVISPTFNYENIYEGKEGRRLYHFDLYRESVLDQDIELMLSESFADPSGVTAVEWAERFKEKWPEKAIVISFNWIGESEREVTVEKR